MKYRNISNKWRRKIILESKVYQLLSNMDILLAKILSSVKNNNVHMNDKKRYLIFMGT